MKEAKLRRELFKTKGFKKSFELRRVLKQTADKENQDGERWDEIHESNFKEKEREYRKLRYKAKTESHVEKARFELIKKTRQTLW